MQILPIHQNTFRYYNYSITLLPGYRHFWHVYVRTTLSRPIKISSSRQYYLARSQRTPISSIMSFVITPRIKIGLQEYFRSSLWTETYIPRNTPKLNIFIPEIIVWCTGTTYHNMTRPWISISYEHPSPSIRREKGWGRSDIKQSKILFPPPPYVFSESTASRNVGVRIEGK